LYKTASGGELARIGLAMTAIAQDLPEVTLLLDEVDAGLGGRSAKRVGSLLAELGTRAQIIAITHQPVVASLASTQVVIIKTEAEGETEAHAAAVSGEPRVHEIARMLSGRIEGTALEHARALLSASDEPVSSGADQE
jgi:DNA repair protein RecN (Recombination protein N)